MTPLHALGIQGAVMLVMLAFQGYCIYRSWRNWKQSERDLAETHEQLLKARLLKEHLLECHSELMDDDDTRPPTVQ